MPRPARAAQGTSPIATVRRLEAPSDLDALQRQIWAETIAASPNEFAPEDAEILRLYCVAASQFRRGTEMVAAGDSKRGLPMQAASSAMLIRAAQRLRLGPKGRRPNGTRVRNASAPSVYDTLPSQPSNSFKGFRSS